MRAGWMVLLAWLGTPAMAAELVVDNRGDHGDRVPQIAVTGLAAAEPIDFQLTLRDARGQTWRSHARLRANLEGVADTATAAAEHGSYRGVDASGLFWSMQPDGGHGSPAPFPLQPSADGLLFEPVPMQLRVVRAGKEIATRTLLRRLSSTDVVAQVVDVQGQRGHLYAPRRALQPGARTPALVTLGGAEGGIEAANAYAAWLASNGYIALAVAYYRAPGLPQDLIEVPIEPVQQAVDWLSRHARVDAQRIGLMGGSWGATVALAVASHEPRVRTVVSWVGSPAPFRGIRRDVPPADYRGVDRAALSWQGKPLGYLPYREDIDWSRPDATHARALEQAMLPIERINGPVMLVAGGDDQLGDSGRMAAVAQRWLSTRRTRPMADEVAWYGDAGHLIGQMLQPTTLRHDTGPHVPVGGTPQGYARADREAGQRVLAFLARALAD